MSFLIDKLQTQSKNFHTQSMQHQARQTFRLSFMCNWMGRREPFGVISDLRLELA